MKQTATFPLLTFSAMLLLPVMALALPLPPMTSVDIDCGQYSFSATQRSNGDKVSTEGYYAALVYHNAHWSTPDVASAHTNNSNTDTSLENQKTGIWLFENGFASSMQIKLYFSGKYEEREGNIFLGGLWASTEKAHVSKLTASEDQLTVASIPESATMLLFGTGILGLAGITRRRMQT
jgi:hypothetical protein